MEEAEILLRNAMEHHGAAVYRLALCRMQSVQDAEDVYQDVFLRLLGIPAATVRTRLRRARKRLKDLLGGDDHEEERLSEFDGAYPAPRRAE